MPASVNCTDGSTPCGYGTVCCPPQDHCVFNRGIPVCENLAQPIISGFLGQPCVDPFIYDCSSHLGIIGFCCPIGTVCFNNGLDKSVFCINTYGTTAAGFPSATQGFMPASTLIPNSDGAVLFEPSGAWSVSRPAPSCSSSKGESSLRVTNTLNSTISYNYTGPSIMIHTVTSSQGGMFAVIVDGFNTTDVIDTLSGPDALLPLCYPVQYPPFLKPPPTLATQNNHTINLVYIGPSPNAPSGSSESSGQFDAFAIPEFSTAVLSGGASTSVTASRKNTMVLSVLVGVMIVSLLSFH